MGVLCRSVTHRAAHSFGDNRAVLRSDFDPIAFEGIKLIRVGAARREQTSAVNQSGVSGEQLDRRCREMIAFTDGFARPAVGLRSLARTDLRIISRCAGQEFTALFAQSVWLSKAEPSQLVDQFVAAETLSEGAKIVVARIGDRLRRSERREFVALHAKHTKTTPRRSAWGHVP